VATATARAERLPLWLAGLIPLAVIGALVALFLFADPMSSFRAVPPAEVVAFERTTLTPNEIALEVRNDGPDPVTIAQVLVDDAYRRFTISDPTLGRLEGATLRIPYPWEQGLPLNIALITSTGVTLEHEIEAAALTPEPDGSTFVAYALLGVYIGVIPVVIGLLWFPSLKRASRRWLHFFLAFTVGLLAFLLLDTLAEGLELAAATPEVFNGLGLLAVGAVAAVVALVALEGSLARRRSGSEGRNRELGALVLAYLVAAGIGLHNLGEGLAVGAALAGGEVALGTALVLGFALHNTTEGLAIVAPLGTLETRPSLWHFGALGVVAGAPTILGALAGGFAFSPAWATLSFGVAAGAIAQVIWQIARGPTRGAGLASGYGAAGLVAGLFVMYVTGLLTV
jgi:ZIP family zinc transporter